MALIATALTRLFDFASGQKIKSADTDAEFNQLVAQHNNVVTDLATLQGSGTATDAALLAHKSSADHDGRYYTETETDAIVLAVVQALDAEEAALVAHKSSGDHDGRYFTEAELTPALALKAPIESPTFTGTVSGVTKAMVGLGNADNTSDINKPVSTAQQLAINAAQMGALADDSITDDKMAPGNKKQDIIDAVLPLIPDAEFDFDNTVGKNGWDYVVSEVGAVCTETYILGVTTKATRVTTEDSPTAGQITMTTTGPSGKVTTIVYDADDSAHISEV